MSNPAVWLYQHVVCMWKRAALGKLKVSTAHCFWLLSAYRLQHACPHAFTPSAVSSTAYRRWGVTLEERMLPCARPQQHEPCSNIRPRNDLARVNMMDVLQFSSH